MPASRATVAKQLLPTLGGLLLIGLVIALPDLGTPRAGAGPDVVTAFRGRVVSIEQPPANSGQGPPGVPIAIVTALDGPRAGETLRAYLTGPGGSQTIAGYATGDEVVVTITQGEDRAEPFIAVSDRWRLPSLQGLALVFAAAVLVVGRWHGARALVALGLTIAVILKVLLPLVISGVAPVPLAVVAATGITVVTIGLTEGLRRSSLAAILGTAAALAVTGLLGATLTAVMGFTYTAGSDLAFLSTQGGQGLDLRGVLLAAFILGAVGVLDDVTVTQAALVEELATKGGLRGRALTASATSIGRSHIAATVNTLFLAYVGAGLPLLVVLLVSRQPAALVLNDETVATEIVRTLVGSLGILTAVPLTTFIAAALVQGADTAPGWGPRARSRQHAVVAAVVGAVAVLLAATVALPALTGTPRAPLTPDVFDPSATFPVPAVSPGTAESDPPGLEEPVLVDVDESVTLELDGRPAATVVVRDLARRGGEPPGPDEVVLVLDYQAVEAFPLDIARWEVLLEDGTTVPLLPAPADSTPPQMLEAGERATLTLHATIPSTADDPFVVYVDLVTLAFDFAVPIADAAPAPSAS